MKDSLKKEKKGEGSVSVPTPDPISDLMGFDIFDVGKEAAERKQPGGTGTGKKRGKPGKMKKRFFFVQMAFPRSLVENPGV